MLSDQLLQPAKKLASKMQEALGLSEQVTLAIEKANISLTKRKIFARRQIGNPKDFNTELQKIELTRNGLYKKALSEKQYQLYLKRRALIYRPMQ